MKISWNIFKLRKDVIHWAKLSSKQALEIVKLKKRISFLTDDVTNADLYIDELNDDIDKLKAKVKSLEKELQAKNNIIAINNAVASVVAKPSRKEKRTERNKKGK